MYDVQIYIQQPTLSDFLSSLNHRVNKVSIVFVCLRLSLGPLKDLSGIALSIYRYEISIVDISTLLKNI